MKLVHHIRSVHQDVTEVSAAAITIYGDGCGKAALVSPAGSPRCMVKLSRRILVILSFDGWLVRTEGVPSKLLLEGL